MQHFTHDDLQPHPMTILLIKQVARMCNKKNSMTHGNNGFAVATCS